MLFPNIDMKVLIIDDNENITSMLEKYLKLKNYECVIENKGKDGLKKILSEKFNYILLDLSMPEFDGYAILDHLEKESSIKEKNIIIFTASNISDNEINQLKERGVYECFRKPVELKKITALLK